jgi:hypothetical protein
MTPVRTSMRHTFSAASSIQPGRERSPVSRQHENLFLSLQKVLRGNFCPIPKLFLFAFLSRLLLTFVYFCFLANLSKWQFSLPGVSCQTLRPIVNGPSFFPCTKQRNTAPVLA